jgi:hypothetical protein
MHTKMVGCKFMLKRNILGNPVGTVGFVFNEYPDFDDHSKLGIQIIFPNGEYDGFSIREQEEFLEQVGYDWRCAGYIFSNVIQVSKDFDNGFWKFLK